MKAVKVPLKQLNDTRKELMEKKIMSMDYRIKTTDEYGYIPITEEDDSYEIEDIELESLKKQPSNFTELLEDILDEDEIENLKTSYDVIGDVVIIEIPEELESKKEDIGEATLKFSKRKSVYMKKSAVKGTTRVRDLELIAGADNPITVHKEHGTRLKLNVKEMYFSPRLATERKRVSDSVKDNERILDMFCGIGPFPSVIAKNNDVEIIGVDINSAAIEYFKENVRLNKLKNVTPICGDMKDVYDDLKLLKFDRIIMNLPGLAYSFLDIAFDLIADDGIINYYEFSDSYENGIERIENIAKEKNKKVEIINTRKVKSTSPGMWHVAIDAKIKDSSKIEYEDMDWAKYKNTASFYGDREAMGNISDEFKKQIINFNGLFPDTLIYDIYGVFPERRDFEEEHPEIRDEQAIRSVSYRYMSEGGEEIGGLWWDETLDFLIEHPEYAQFYESTRMTVTETDEDYYVPIEELIEARKKELNL